MRELIVHIAQALADKPEEVQVREVEGEQTSVIELKVAKGDLGKVIGKQGRTARAMRIILSAASTKLRKRASLRGELAAKKWREYFQDEFFVEGEDEVGSGGEDVRHGACEAMAAGDIIRNRQPLRRIGAKGAECLIAGKGWQ